MFDALRQPSELVPDATRYARITIWSAVPARAAADWRSSDEASSWSVPRSRSPR